MFTLGTQCQTTLTLNDFCPYHVQEFGISKGFHVHTVKCHLNSRKNVFLNIFKHSEDHIYSLYRNWKNVTWTCFQKPWTNINNRLCTIKYQMSWAFAFEEIKQLRKLYDFFVVWFSPSPLFSLIVAHIPTGTFVLRIYDSFIVCLYQCIIYYLKGNKLLNLKFDFFVGRLILEIKVRTTKENEFKWKRRMWRAE